MGYWRGGSTATWAAPSTGGAGRVARHSGPAIDEALRLGAATLDQMWEAHALQPGRPGNEARRILLNDSRDLPWSEAEREGHPLLRRAGLRGWQTNQEVTGSWVDVLFRRYRLVLEIDGWAVHGRRQAFEDDRVGRDHLVLAGYTDLNVTWASLSPSQVGSWTACGVRSARGEPGFDLYWQV